MFWFYRHVYRPINSNHFIHFSTRRVNTAQLPLLLRSLNREEIQICSDLSSDAISIIETDSDNESPPKKKKLFDEKPDLMIVQPTYDRCKHCKQIKDDSIKFFNTERFKTLNNEVMSEQEAVVDTRIALDTDEFQDFILDQFRIYDENRHLIHLDAGLIEAGKKILFSGIVNSCFAENYEGGIAVIDAGSIAQW